VGVLKKRFESTRALLRFLDNLATDDELSWVFRGHSDERHRLKTSLERYWTLIHEEQNPKVDQVLNQFRDGLIRTGLPRLPPNSRLAWMELARHHGAPTPLLDFSWSPYVALFFAFNRVRDLPGKGTRSVLYALNTSQLGKHWARENACDPSGPEFSRLYRNFQDPSPELFAASLPENTVRFLPWAGEHSPRMQHQMGAFLYCTLDYAQRDVADLEGYLELLEDGFESPMLPNTAEPTLIKLLLPHSMAEDVFKRLELVNITGASLFGSADGVADDIWNGFNYNRRLHLRTEGRIGG